MIKVIEGNNSIDKKNIGELFDKISPTYDYLNHLLSFNIDRRWRKIAVRKINGFQNKILDLATGTGDMAIEIIKQNKAKTVYGVDISNKMLEICQKKIQQYHFEDRIILSFGDSFQLKFPDNSFNTVTVSFGIRNFQNLDKGLQEIYRILDKHGQLIILEFSYPNNLFIRSLYNLYINRILPLIGKKISKNQDAYYYLPLSVKNFIYGKKFRDKLTETGFNNVSYKQLSLGICTLYLGEK